MYGKDTSDFINMSYDEFRDKHYHIKERDFNELRRVYSNEVKLLDVSSIQRQTKVFDLHEYKKRVGETNLQLSRFNCTSAHLFSALYHMWIEFTPSTQTYQTSMDETVQLQQVPDKENVDAMNISDFLPKLTLQIKRVSPLSHYLHSM